MSDERFLTVRQFGGNPLADEVGPVTESTPPFTQTRRRLVLLVHGYNNTQEAAHESFTTFVKDLRGMGAGGQAIAADVGFVYWPGDWNVGQLISAASYPFQIPRATRSGENLGEYLANLVGPGGTPTDIYMVGHSLGCRVILEILATMSRRGGDSVRVVGTSFMAAAVPVAMASDRWPQLAGIGRPDRTWVLHSEHDPVLAFAFPFGQTVAGEYFFPRAVGRFGEPAELWTRRRDCAPNTHGDYWPDARAASETARLLGAPVPGDPPAAVLPERPVAEPVPIETRSLMTRAIPSRELQGQ